MAQPFRTFEDPTSNYFEDYVGKPPRDDLERAALGGQYPYCNAKSPRGTLVCTLRPGHVKEKTDHVAGGGNVNYARWPST